MLDTIALERVSTQMGTLAVNYILLERDIEVMQETITNKQNRIEELEAEFKTISEQRDQALREAARLETLLQETT
jgi:cell division protein FtsB